MERCDRAILQTREPLRLAVAEARHSADGLDFLAVAAGQTTTPKAALWLFAYRVLLV